MYHTAVYLASTKRGSLWRVGGSGRQRASRQPCFPSLSPSQPMLTSLPTQPHPFSPTPTHPYPFPTHRPYPPPSPQLVCQVFKNVLGEAFQRLAMMNNDAGAAARAESEAADLLPTAVVGKSYGMLLARVVLHCGPGRILDLLDGHGVMEAWAVAVMVELGGIRYIEDMFRQPIGTQVASKGQEERVLSALAATCLLDAGRESAWACVGAIVSLSVEALMDIRSIRGDDRDGARQPLPLLPADVPDGAADDEAGPLEQEEGAVPNQARATNHLAMPTPLYLCITNGCFAVGAARNTHSVFPANSASVITAHSFSPPSSTIPFCLTRRYPCPRVSVYPRIRVSVAGGRPGPPPRRGGPPLHPPALRLRSRRAAVRKARARRCRRAGAAGGGRALAGLRGPRWGVSRCAARALRGGPKGRGGGRRMGRRMGASGDRAQAGDLRTCSEGL